MNFMIGTARIASIVIVALCLLLYGQPGHATVIHVPTDAPTIQSAVDLAVSGDVIQVAPGSYSGVGNVNVAIRSKRISIESSDGPELTEIDCRFSGPAFDTQEFDAIDRSTRISGFTIRNAFSDWGAIRADAPVRIDHCRFIDNQSRINGGAISGRGSAWISHCLFDSNHCASRGGAVYFQQCAPIIDHCTFVNNETLSSGESICLDDARATIVNSILWDDHPVNLIKSNVTCTFSAIRSDVLPAWAIEGCINSDPQFTDPSEHDFSVNLASPCIDAGDPLSRLDSDMSRSDMGFTGGEGLLPDNVIGGDFSGDIAPNQQFLVVEDLVVQPGSSVTIGLGCTFRFRNGAGLLVHGTIRIFCPDQKYVWFEPDRPDSHFGSIRCVNAEYINITGIWVEGGASEQGGAFFVSNGMLFLWRAQLLRNWAGKYGGALCAQNTRAVISQVVAHQNRTAGNQDMGGRGGGMAFRNSDCDLYSCWIAENTTPFYGGGIYADWDSYILMLDSALTGNRSLFSEAGATIYHGTMIRTQILDNHAYNDTGGIWTYDGSITASIIAQNSAVFSGGGFTSDYGVFGSSLIAGNTASQGGGSFLFSSSRPTILNCTFSDNEADSGGAAYMVSGARPTIENCIFWNNETNELVASTGVSIRYSAIRDGLGKPYFGEGCIDMNPLFTTGLRDNYYLSQVSSGQPYDSPCLNRGALPADATCFQYYPEPICLSELISVTDHSFDLDMADMGYHRPEITLALPTIAPTPTPTATPTSRPMTPPPASPTPSSTPSPIPTAAPCITPHVEISMPSGFHQGNLCFIDLDVCIPEPMASQQIPFSVIALLAVADQFYFFPSWSSEIDWETWTSNTVRFTVPVLPAFLWPPDIAPGNGQLYAAIADEGVSDLISNIANTTFSWY